MTTFLSWTNDGHGKWRLWKVPLHPERVWYDVGVGEIGRRVSVCHVVRGSVVVEWC